MTRVRIVVLGMTIIAGLCWPGTGWQGTALAAMLYSIDIDRTSSDPEAPTFSGSGLIRFDGPASSVADIEAFSLQLETIGGPLPVTRRFDFGLSDIVSVAGLVAAPLLGGVIELAPGKVSEDGAAVLGGSGDTTVLDFTGRLATAFCFAAESEEQCILGGGSSTAIEAELNSAIVPLPRALPLLLVALAGLGLFAGPAGGGAGRRAG